MRQKERGGTSGNRKKELRRKREKNRYETKDKGRRMSGEDKKKEGTEKSKRDKE